MPRISLIVPAFDVADYLGALVGDLQQQTYTDFEVLVVDDGSTDDTREIVARVADDDARFVLLSSGGSGLGPSAARNVALDAATGDEVAFADADDRVAPRFLATMRASMDATGSELVSCNARRLHGFSTSASSPHFRVFDREELRTHITRSPRLVYDMTVWNKLAKRDLLERTATRFDEGRWLNDTYPSMRMHAAASQADVLTDVLYFWRQRERAGSSITDSKFSDPAARLKSLADRLHALHRSRVMLGEELDDATVLDAFDERAVTHDFWVYLSLFDSADDSYRAELIRSVTDYLTRYDVDPDRYDIGVHLQTTYRAMLRGDTDRVADLLAPASRVVGEAVDGRIRARIEPVAPTPWYRSIPILGDSGHRHPDVTERLDATVRIEDLRPDPTGSPRLLVAGSARIRDGRHAIHGPWRVRFDLEGKRTSAAITTDPVAIGPCDDQPDHPMLSNGWCPFHAVVDLAATRDHPEEDRWRLRAYVRLDDVEVRAKGRITPHASRALSTSLTIDDAYDLVPTVKNNTLSLRREDAPVRLTRVHADVDGRVELLLAISGATVPDRIWFRPPESQLAVETEVSGGDGPELAATFDLSRTTTDEAPRWELWAAYDDDEQRVRAHATLPTMRLPRSASAVGSGGLVLRPTTLGRVVIDPPATPLVVDDLQVSADRPATIVVSGRVLAPDDPEEKRLEARNRWTSETVAAVLDIDGDSWQARFHTADLGASLGPAAPDRSWTLHLGDVALTLATEGRERLPLRCVDDGHVIELRIGSGARAQLHVAVSAEPSRS